MIQNLDLTSGIDWNPTATIAASQRAKQESDQRLTEGQLNIRKLQLAIDQATKEQTENDQIKQRLTQGGDPNEIYNDLLKINPDKAAKYRQDFEARAAAQRTEAIQNYQTNPNPIMPMQSTPQAPAEVAAPQLTTAPIQTNLTGAPQMSAPQTAPQANNSILRNVNLPNRWQMAPAPDVTIPSATGGAPLVIPGQNRDQAIAAAQAAEWFKTNEAIRAKLSEPITTPEGGITSVIGPEGKPITIQGQAKESEIEKEAKPWLAKNPGKTLDDYVRQKGIDTAASSEYGQKLAAFNSNPALVKQFGAGPNGLSAKEHADQVQVREQEARAAVVQQQALQQGAVKSVAPHLIIPATEAYAKDSKAYVDAAQAADDMKTFVTESQAGNKLAYSYTPAEGALYLSTSRGVKRINANEINAYGGGGSAWDRVQAFLGKQLSGASIPPALLKDMAEVNQAVGVNAKTAYQRKVDVTNKAFGSTFEPMDFGSGSTAAPLSFTYQGKTLTFPDQKSYDAAKAAAGIK